MKKVSAILLAMMLVFTLAACGNNETPDPSVSDDPAISQTDSNVTEENGNVDEPTDSEENNQEEPANDSENDDENIPTVGTPLGWPDNDYTKLVPTPNVGGKVLTSGEIGTLFAIELKWSMDQGLAYAQQLQDAGFGEDCVEKYEQNGTLDRTAGGVNVQLVDLFGVTSITIMKVE